MEWIPTRNNLANRGVLLSAEEQLCVFCGQYAETEQHLFFTCKMATAVWGRVCGWLGLSLDLHLDSPPLFAVTWFAQ